MPLPDTADAFEAAFRAAVTVVLPTATVEQVSRTLVVIKLRVELNRNRFIDVFFNSRNGRTDLAVVEGGQRVFGYDNLGGWHRHPFDSPEDREVCMPPDLDDFVHQAANLPPST
jgi:hypothetical protein